MAGGLSARGWQWPAAAANAEVLWAHSNGVDVMLAVISALGMQQNARAPAGNSAQPNLLEMP